MSTRKTSTAMGTSTLAHHLRVAADQYDANAQTCRDQGKLNPAQKEGMESLAKTFDDQAAQARAWALAMEAADEVRGPFSDEIEVSYEIEEG